MAISGLEDNATAHPPYDVHAMTAQYPFDMAT
jgi:hypothetical protein